MKKLIEALKLTLNDNGMSITTLNTIRQTITQLEKIQSNGKTKDEVKEIALMAWKGAANAFRMYPNQKHTFSDYWHGAEWHLRSCANQKPEEDKTNELKT